MSDEVGGDVPPMTEIEHHLCDCKFVIAPAPTDENMLGYIRELDKHEATIVVRACEATYDDAILSTKKEVKVIEFNDGEPPPAEAIANWLAVTGLKNKKTKKPLKKRLKPKVVSVHCIAGLGRSAILVAIALIESGVEPQEAIDLVREKRRGALNAQHRKYLLRYKKVQKPKRCGCAIL